MSSPLERLGTPLTPTTGTVIHGYALRLRQIRFETHIGVSAEERAVGQELVVDVDLTLAAEAIPIRDVLSEAVDYETIVECVVEEGIWGTHQLLETYVRRVITRLLAELPVESVRVAVTKKKVPTRHPVGEAIVELVASRSLQLPLVSGPA
jgi:dihydroneopterin aldolase